MAELDTEFGPRHHLAVLHRHVLGPLSRALDVADRERTELAAEGDAFADFARRVERIPADSGSEPRQRVGDGLRAAPSQRTEDLRRAYRETVMAVPHYDDVYGESLATNAAAELGPDLAELVRAGSRVSFTPSHRSLLLGAAEKQARERETCRASVDGELDSLRSMRRELSDLLDTLDTSVVPAWYRSEFETRLDSIHADRQETIYGRSMPAALDSHTLCEYLYRDQVWTYPVLTAVARLRSSVVFRDE